MTHMESPTQGGQCRVLSSARASRSGRVRKMWRLRARLCIVFPIQYCTIRAGVPLWLLCRRDEDKCVLWSISVRASSLSRPATSHSVLSPFPTSPLLSCPSSLPPPSCCFSTDIRKNLQDQTKALVQDSAYARWSAGCLWEAPRQAKRVFPNIPAPRSWYIQGQTAAGSLVAHSHRD